ncbi:unnamed protein product [Paramecium sonneborni]|uniref:Uncharacterized protein n=1 Tax=Paramecium sonneborni TaxID=65129 RepID=A0A8S1KIA9_9CILI|nr:unnamed protein product [Paramecium sonneborni]
MNNAAEKLCDILNASLTELESNINSSAIKYISQPQNLLEDLEQTIIDFKTKFYEFIHNLLKFFGQLNNDQDILKIAEQLENYFMKYKQQQLFIQMKATLTIKLKALMDTFCGENKQKLEVQNQIKQLQECLMKIELTLFEQQQILSPQQYYYITPHPKKNFIQQSSKNNITPNLSQDAELRAKGVFITPENRQQQPRQFENSHQQYSSNERYTLVQNKTLNSFDKENKTDLLSPMFGFQEQTIQQTQSLENDMLNQLEQNFFKAQIGNKSFDLSNKLIQQTFQNPEQLQIIKTEQLGNLLESDDQPKTRNQSVDLNKENQLSPKGKRLIQTSKSKKSFSRCTIYLDTTNLLQKLNLVEASKHINIQNKSDKENQPNYNIKQLKSNKPVSLQKQKGQPIKKVQSQENLLKKQKSN